MWFGESDREVTGLRNVISLFLSAEDGGEKVKWVDMRYLVISPV